MQNVRNIRRTGRAYADFVHWIILPWTFVIAGTSPDRRGLPASLAIFHLHISRVESTIYYTGWEMRDRNDREAIEQRLREELDGARADYEAAFVVFDFLVKNVANGNRPADGELRLEQTADIKRRALQTYTRALARFAHY